MKIVNSYHKENSIFFVKLVEKKIFGQANSHLFKKQI